MHDVWKRVSKQRPCPICNKPDWCMVHEDGTAVICPRTQQGCVKDLGDAGYLHHLEGHQSTGGRIFLPRRLPSYTGNSKPEDSLRPNFDASKVMKQYRSSLSSKVLGRWASLLGVRPEPLERLCIGRTNRGAMAFPMKNAAGETIGIRIRDEAGRKWAYPGSRNGLFIPADRPDSTDSMVCICEGPTDTAALLGLGFDAIGRPSCSGGREMVRVLCASRDVCIVEDPDGPGQRGAETLANELVRVCSSVRVLQPLVGKDLREWIKEANPTWQVVSAVLNSTPLWHRGRKGKYTSA